MTLILSLKVIAKIQQKCPQTTIINLQNALRKFRSVFHNEIIILSKSVILQSIRYFIYLKHC